MNFLVPLVIALPLMMAALLVGIRHLIPRMLSDLLAILTSLGVTLGTILLLKSSIAHSIVYWFGGWKPQNGIAVGIAFFIDPLSASMAVLIAFLVTSSLLFAWRYFEVPGMLFHGLMLVFLAAMVGFSFSGDLFTLFVFFELMSVVAFALTGYKIEASSIEGALNFAITNTIGACLSLWGIGLLYGRTGALNFAQISRALSHTPADWLLIVTFVLICCGFLIKAAVVPFHFWLGDAHAVAPTPVCVLFSGVMVELGVFGVFRVYWDIFEPVLKPYASGLRIIFLALGAVTAIVGAIMCYWQRHIKRLLAFSTISHMGMILAGCGCLSASGLAGAALYLLGHSMVKGALFMSAGVILQRFGSVDLKDLQGCGRDCKWIGLIVAIAGLGLAGFPPFGTYQGKALMEEAARDFGQGWMIWIFTFASVMTGAAVLRIAARVFLGWGSLDREEESAPTEPEKKETQEPRLPWVMVTMAGVLAVLPAGSGLLTWLANSGMHAAERFIDNAGIVAQVLDAIPMPPVQTKPVQWEGILLGTAAALGAVGIALLDLFCERLPPRVVRIGYSIIKSIIEPLRRIHSGDLRDYTAWVVAGAALLGLAMAWAVL